jgi:hypothetical protein
MDHSARRGAFAHLVAAFTPDGTPLGSVWVQLWARTQDDPTPPPRILIKLIAQLGGYVNRPGRIDPPGPQTVWPGLQRRQDLAWAWDTFGPVAAPVPKQAAGAGDG